ncbi:flagellar filament capping protein FliD [Paenibacillus radicis (ex Gao et al. 2016)]|nr:flagellar filament capping protein FliD [Paenibacillus radicis (ex Gao et al. 2016)]
MTGLASGLDIDSMVKELMKAKRTTYDNMVKQRTKVEWKQEDYRSLSTKIVDFRNNKLSSFNLSSAINAKTSAVSGDTAALTINSTSSTAAGTLTVKVEQVAASDSKVYTFSAADKVKNMTDLGFTTEDPDNADNVLVTINSQTVSVAKTANLTDLSKAINEKSSTLKATSIYDEASGQFSIAATQTGAGKLVLGDAVFTAKTPTGGSVGLNAKISINGINYEQASNRFSLNGFDFTVKSASVTTNGTTISAVQDTQKIVDTIKSFVTEYNSLIGAINSELSEVADRNYKPLTSEEKKAMTDDEIKLWETKARNGSLRNDGTLSQFISDLRIAATSLVSGIKDSSGNPLSIGITTGSYTEKGKLVLDEDKLKNALEINPDAVVKVFSSRSSDTSPGSTTSGVFAKMSASSLTALNILSTKAGTSLTSTDATATFLNNSLLSEQIKSMKDREKSMLDRLNAMEKQYYKQFSAMETAINKFNSQSSAIMSFTS